VTRISVNAVGFSFDQTEILKDISLACARGEFVGILGPNGAGKSTLLKLIAGLHKASTGGIFIDDAPSENLSAQECAATFAYLPQRRIIHWPVSVETLVGLGRLPYQTFWQRPSQSDTDIVEAAMARADVTPMRHRLATKLSGGEQERVLLARMLAQEAAILLADEPTSALDPEHQIGIMATFKSLAESGHLVLAALHDINLAARWCDRLIILKDGRIVEDGKPADILSEQMMRATYNVDSSITRIDNAPVVTPTAIARQSKETP
jgi:iron complex transport system ATP-binding protein